MMPRRNNTRAQDRAKRIDTERKLNDAYVAERNRPRRSNGGCYTGNRLVDDLREPRGRLAFVHGDDVLIARRR
jgi:hypothetical protein